MSYAHHKLNNARTSYDTTRLTYYELLPYPRLKSIAVKMLVKMFMQILEDLGITFAS